MRELGLQGPRAHMPPRTNADSTLLDHGTVGLVDDAIDLLEIVGVGEELVTGEDIL